MSGARRRSGALVLALALMAGACGGESGGSDEASGTGDAGHEHGHDEAAAPAFEEAEATTTVDVTLQDYAFVGVPATVKGPNVLFETEIKGSNTHELDVFDASGKSVGVIPPHKGSATKTLAVVLAPGAYELRCLVKEGAKTHAQLGMEQSLTVE